MSLRRCDDRMHDFLLSGFYKSQTENNLFNDPRWYDWNPCQMLTSISCTPTNSGIFVLAFFDSSRHNSTTSFKFLIRTSIVLAWVCAWNAGNLGYQHFSFRISFNIRHYIFFHFKISFIFFNIIIQNFFKIQCGFKTVIV